MGITARTLTVQDISRLANNTKAKARLEQPVTPVTVHWKPLSKMHYISTPEEVANVCYMALCAVDEFCAEVEATFRFYGFPLEEVCDYHMSAFLSLLYRVYIEHPLNDTSSAFSPFNPSLQGSCWRGS